VMGILNVTPDSFSDGGQFALLDSALRQAEQMLAEGANLLDVGGESTRPGAEPVSVEEELRRVVPVVRELTRRTNALISVDTTKESVARATLAEGAHIINDISACRFEPAILDPIREYRAGVILMHMQGTPQTMQLNPSYSDVVTEVRNFLQERIQFLEEAGIAADSIAIDPGIGFGKTHEHNMMLLKELREFQKLRKPLCLGVSRKGFIGQITGKPRNDRVAGSVAVACDALTRQSAQIIRVHDVAPTVDAVRMIEAIRLS